MAGIAMLQNARAKLKLEDEKLDKKEPAVPQPSPNKKHASEMEKKVKNMPGDTCSGEGKFLIMFIFLISHIYNTNIFHLNF